MRGTYSWLFPLLLTLVMPSATSVSAPGADPESGSTPTLTGSDDGIGDPDHGAPSAPAVSETTHANKDLTGSEDDHFDELELQETDDTDDTDDTDTGHEHEPEVADDTSMNPEAHPTAPSAAQPVVDKEMNGTGLEDMSNLGNGTMSRLEEAVPGCIRECVTALKECKSAGPDGEPTCACAEAAEASCEPEKQCDVPSLVGLVHAKARLCGRPITDPLIKALRDRATATGSTPQEDGSTDEDEDDTADNSNDEHDQDPEVAEALVDGLMQPPADTKVPRSSVVQPGASGSVPCISDKDCSTGDKCSEKVCIVAAGVSEQAGVLHDSSLSECRTEVDSLTRSVNRLNKMETALVGSLLTLGGSVTAPKNAEALQNRGIKPMEKHVRDQLQEYVAKNCARTLPGNKTQPGMGVDADEALQVRAGFNFCRRELAEAKRKSLLQARKVSDANQKISAQAKKYNKLKTVLGDLIKQMQAQDGEPMRGEYWRSSELIEKLFRRITNSKVKDGSATSWLGLAEVYENPDRNLAEFADPVFVSITYGIATVPALLLVCLSRFPAVKDFFLLQSLFFNCAVSGVFGLLAVLAAYCGFNPLKIVLGHDTRLPAFELIFMCLYAYAAACNVFLLFLQRGATDKLHAFLSMAIGAHLYWMLYTLGQKDSGMPAYVFYWVYFVCFSGCSIAKLRGVAVLHLGGNVRKSMKSGRKPIAVKDEEKGAVFELGDDMETAGLVG